MTWRIEPPKIDSRLSGFCQFMKFRVRVSVGFRVRVRVGFRVKVRVGFRVMISLVYNISCNTSKTEKNQKTLI